MAARLALVLGTAEQISKISKNDKMYIYNAKSATGASVCRENEINKINGLLLIRSVRLKNS